MTGLYIPEIAQLLRDAGLQVEELFGWETNARGSGGFDNNRVEGMSIHHDASSSMSDPAQTAIYLAYGMEFSPVGNLYLDRTGRWWCIAAGASNTSGAGGPWFEISKDNANRRTLGIEIANNGRGEPYPVPQQLSLLHGVSVLWNFFSERYDWGLETWRVFGHFEWAPDRKVDPSGPAQWMDETDRWKRWDMGSFRLDVINHAIELAQPPVEPPEPDVIPTAEGQYIVQAGEYPWKISEKVYGTGKYYDLLQAENPGTWHPNDKIKIPNKEGYLTIVKDGEGPYSVIRRAGLQPGAATLRTFYLYNGGQSYVLKPGERVFVEKV